MLNLIPKLNCYVQKFDIEEYLKGLTCSSSCKDGFWVSLGALATRTVCFLNHCVSDAPLLCQKKVQSEIKYGIVTGSEVWLI